MFERKKIIIVFSIALILVAIVGLTTGKHSLIVPQSEKQLVASGANTAEGKVYTVNYTVTAGGKTIDTTDKALAEKAGIYEKDKGDKYYAPAQLVVGIGRLPKTLDTALLSMKAGDHQKITVPAKEAFGDKEMTFESYLSDMAYIRATSTKQALLSVGNKESDIAVGKKVTTGTGSPMGEVLSLIGDNTVSLRLPNDNNPFKGKIPVVGQDYELPSKNILSVNSYDQKTGKLSVTVKNTNPFAGMEATFDLSVLSIDTPPANGSGSQSIR